jgi:hypothetical protein
VWSLLGFTTPLVGYALQQGSVADGTAYADETSQLWRTADGGAVVSRDRPRLITSGSAHTRSARQDDPVDTVVWVDSWQQQCCGEGFSVGSAVRWAVNTMSEAADWFATPFGEDSSVRIEYGENHHGDPNGRSPVLSDRSTSSSASGSTHLHLRMRRTGRSEFLSVERSDAAGAADRRLRA